MIEPFPFDDWHRAITDLRGRQIFFLGGAMKSGTTWLQLLLDRHPEISCNGEGHFPTYLIPTVIRAADSYNEDIAWKNQTVFGELPGFTRLSDDQIAYLWGAGIALLLDSQRRARPDGGTAVKAVGEKTPDNVRFFSLLAGMFPTAKFIEIVRDGRDCAVSGWFHNRRVSPDWLAETYNGFEDFITRTAADWVAAVAAGDAFGLAEPNRYRRIRYEDLLADPVATLRPLLGFLGVGDDVATAAHCCEATSFTRLTSGRAAGSEDRGSFFRKGVAGDWRHHLDPETESAFRERAEGWLERLGYERGGASRP